MYEISKKWIGIIRTQWPLGIQLNWLCQVLLTLTSTKYQHKQDMGGKYQLTLPLVCLVSRNYDTSFRNSHQIPVSL